jgi:hypothetical protein
LIENRGDDPVDVTWPVTHPMIRQLGFPRTLPAHGGDSSRVFWKTAAGLPVFVHVPLMLSSPHARSVMATVAIPTFLVRESGEYAR